jgi:DNA-binding transcriptional LysR family regulator
MDSLSGLLAFVRTGESGNFVAASERLGVSPSAVAKSVARLEVKLGVRLFHRSTRRISLTEEGTLFFERCQRIIGDIDEAEAELVRSTGVPRGRLRVSLPAAAHRLLLPLLPEFTQRYPDIELDLDFNDRMVDLIAEGLDAVIRSGDLASSSLRARPLGTFRFRLVGAPGYFTRRGLPLHPQELQQHTCLRYRFPSSGLLQEWRFMGTDTTGTQVPCSQTFNSVDALISAAEGGMGIAYLPDFAVQTSLATGVLAPVLESYVGEGGSFAIIWPNSRALLPKLRVFVDFLAQRLPLPPPIGRG